MSAHQPRIAGRSTGRERRVDARISVSDDSIRLWDRHGSLGRILDVSAGGLQLATDAPLCPGEWRQLNFSVLDMFSTDDPARAEVVWFRAGRAGLSFCDISAAARTLSRIFSRWSGRAKPDVILRWIDELCAPLPC